jgi:hypothetical protein
LSSDPGQRVTRRDGIALLANVLRVRYDWACLPRWTGRGESKDLLIATTRLVVAFGRGRVAIERLASLHRRRRRSIVTVALQIGDAPGQQRGE